MESAMRLVVRRPSKYPALHPPVAPRQTRPLGADERPPLPRPSRKRVRLTPRKRCDTTA